MENLEIYVCYEAQRELTLLDLKIKKFIKEIEIFIKKWKLDELNPMDFMINNISQSLDEITRECDYLLSIKEQVYAR